MAAKYGFPRLTSTITEKDSLRVSAVNCLNIPDTFGLYDREGVPAVLRLLSISNSVKQKFHIF
jgi:hypothetical protein